MDLEPGFQRARALHQAGQLAAAAAAYRDLLAADPRHFRAQNNLGDCLDRLGAAAEAEAAFRAATLLAPGEARPQYNLGRQLHLRGELDAAEACYRRAIELDPAQADAMLNLGRLLDERGQEAAALVLLEQAVAADPSAVACAALGHALFEAGRLPEAQAAYERAAAAAPGGEAHFHVGRTLEAMRRADEALGWHRRALAADPGSVAARQAIVRTLAGAGRRDEALAELRAWLAQQPGQPLAAHMLAALGGAPAPARASDAYVATTFDRFADSFDRALARLDYQAPQLVAAAVRRHLDPSLLDAGRLAVLDAGCGTGLCGPLLRPHARRLVGVDLSAGMLAQARQRGGYDELVEAELTAYLRSQPARFNLIACADTLCYFGALDEVLAAMAQALAEGGLLAFTVERQVDAADAAIAADAANSPRLHEHGRYSHAEAYVARALGDAGLRPVEIAQAPLRNEGGVPVPGLVATARRLGRAPG